MFVWKKSKPIYLEVIMQEKFYSVEPLVKTIRDKKTCMKPTSVPTFSTCYSNVEVQKQTLTLKSWYEFIVELTPKGISFNPPNLGEANLEGHTDQAQQLCDQGNFEIIKLQTPVLVRCKENIHFVMAPSPFAMLDLYMPSGYIVWDQQNDINIFFYYPRNTQRTFKINFGQPLIQFYPITDRPIKLKYIYDTNLHKKISTERQKYFHVHSLRKHKKLGIKPYWHLK